MKTAFICIWMQSSSNHTSHCRERKFDGLMARVGWSFLWSYIFLLKSLIMLFDISIGLGEDYIPPHEWHSMEQSHTPLPDSSLSSVSTLQSFRQLGIKWANEQVIKTDYSWWSKPSECFHITREVKAYDGMHTMLSMYDEHLSWEQHILWGSTYVWSYISYYI